MYLFPNLNEMHTSTSKTRISLSLPPPHRILPGSKATPDSKFVGEGLLLPPFFASFSRKTRQNRTVSSDAPVTFRSK